jgi:hypothetical protein
VQIWYESKNASKTQNSPGENGLQLPSILDSDDLAIVCLVLPRLSLPEDPFANLISIP